LSGADDDSFNEYKCFVTDERQVKTHTFAICGHDACDLLVYYQRQWVAE